MTELALVAALVVQTAASAGIIRWLTRQHFRERDLLENKLCSLAGTPWQEPPARAERAPRRPSGLTATPEQLP